MVNQGYPLFLNKMLSYRRDSAWCWQKIRVATQHKNQDYIGGPEGSHSQTDPAQNWSTNVFCDTDNVKQISE